MRLVYSSAQKRLAHTICFVNIIQPIYADGRKIFTDSKIMTLWTPIMYECRRTSCDTFNIIFCKIEMHHLFLVEEKIHYPVIKILKMSLNA